MNLALLLPTGLFALGALLVPLMLHLARRSEHRTIAFSALRWLPARARPRRRVRLVEKGLLVVRLVLVSALALLLAGPVWTSSMRSRPWTVVVPGARLPPAQPEKSSDGDDERRWLAPGYPALDAPTPGAHIPVDSLLRELDAQLPASSPLTVWVPRELSGLDGASIELARRIEWRIAPGAVLLPPTPTISLAPFAVRLERGREAALAYLRAAWLAWMHDSPTGSPGRAEANPLPDISHTASAPKARDGTLVWLRAGEMPSDVRKWILGGGTILIEPRTNWRVDPSRAAVVWRDDAGRPLAHAVRSGRGRVVRLEVPLDESAIPALLDGTIATALRELLHPRDVAPSRVLARDVAPVFRSATLRRAVPMQRDRNLESWLAWLIAAAFVLERLLATAARRWRSA